MATFPTGIFSWTTVVDNIDNVLATHPNSLAVEIIAEQTKIGVDGSAISATLDYFLKHASGAYRMHHHDGTSDDGAKIILTSDVTGTLPIANGGTASTSTTYCNLTSNVTGTLPIANGGTASTSTTYCNLTSNVTGTLPIANGGTAATSVAAAFTSIVVPKVYDSGWFAVAGDTSYAKTHNLGTTKCLIQVMTSTSSDGSADCFLGYATYDRGHTEYAGYEGVDVVALTTSAITVRFCTSGYGYSQKVNASGSGVQPAYTRVIMIALE